MQRGEDRLMQAAVFGMDTSNIDNLDASVICAPVRGELSMQDHKNYTVADGAPVQEILTCILGPLCDENRDAFHRLKLKMQELGDNDFAKKNMKVEMWTFNGDGTTWVNATSIFKYIYTGARDLFARTQKMHFENTHIPHKLLEVPGVSTIFLFHC
jgi:hypothetical protein